MTGYVKDITGERYGKLIALSVAVNTVYRSWRCRCDCGNIKVARQSTLREGDVKSCGCLERVVNIEGSIKGGSVTVHGDAPRSRKTKEYRAWQNMKQRCYNPNHKAFPNYGARGIVVCKRWLGPHCFETFLADVGRAPSPELSIDRINVNGNYTPSNVRWADATTQANNRRAA